MDEYPYLSGSDICHSSISSFVRSLQKYVHLVRHSLQYRLNTVTEISILYRLASRDSIHRHYAMSPFFSGNCAHKIEEQHDNFARTSGPDSDTALCNYDRDADLASKAILVKIIYEVEVGSDDVEMR